MPVQHTFFGQPVRLRMPPRRFQLLLAFILFLVVTLCLFGPPSSTDLPTYEEVAEAVKNPHVPSLQDLPTVPNPFGPSAHKPPVQPNSTVSSSYGAIQWIKDHKWRNPFSSSVSFDENTAVLPPLKERPPIYTFYEVEGKQDKAVAEAENRLILAWRRAWWAQGFQPQVLSRAEAFKHPQYELVQRLRLGKLDSKVENEVLRWLAWGYMGGGILTNWLALPMANYDNAMLSFLRRKEYPTLSRVDTLNNGVFYGEEAAVNEAIKKAIANPLFKNTTANKDKIINLKNKGGAMINLLSKDDIKTDSKANGIAYYSTITIENTYKSLADKLTNSTDVQGLDLLADLINSHLHLTFQNTFPDGIAVVKPLPEHTTALMYEAIEIARNLTQCPTSPIPKSCPPNKPKCTPCDPAKTLKLQLVSSMQNSSTLYMIGTVPHPYTLNLLHYSRDVIDALFLRREAGRDEWVLAVTRDLSDAKHSGGDRVVYFKENVAAPHNASNSLWLTAERVSQADLEWILGFNLPRQASANNEPSSPNEKSELIIFPRPALPTPIEGVVVPDESSIKTEEERLQKARDAIKSEDKHWQGVIRMVEQWNLAHTEAWRFARAFSARRRQERKKWEEEEKRYAGSERKSGVKSGSSGGGGGSRWSDKI
jgi:hypothetical protein